MEYERVLVIDYPGDARFLKKIVESVAPNVVWETEVLLFVNS